MALPDYNKQRSNWGHTHYKHQDGAESRFSCLQLVITTEDFPVSLNGDEGEQVWITCLFHGGVGGGWQTAWYQAQDINL